MANTPKKIEKFFKPSVTVDIVIFTVHENELKVLLIERAAAPFKGMLALPGGFLRDGESTQEAAARVLKEKAGVQKQFIEQLYTFDDVGRDPRGTVLSVTYMALVSESEIAPKTEEDGLQHPQFISVQQFKTLAFDHKKIIQYAVKRVQTKLQYTNLAYSLLPRFFTLTQLQEVYETIIGTALDKRNFRKKFLELGLIKMTSKMTSGGRQRPARLYTFKDKKPAELQKFF